MESKEIHLDIYQDRSVLYISGKKLEFLEGTQDVPTQKNMEKIKKALDDGFLEKLVSNIRSYDFSSLDDETKCLIDSIFGKMTSEMGRALLGLAFLQLTIKSIVPEQCVRLYKGGTREGTFSWQKGISMRTIDKLYNTPFLRKYGLVNLNADGLMMTRSLAENYPYTQLYKAEMRGPFHEWISIVDNLEDGRINPMQGLNYLLSLLINRSDKITRLGEDTCRAADGFPTSYDDCYNLLVDFYENTRYSARAFEVVIHSFMQAYLEMGFSDLDLVPMSQMRSANKKHGNVGDVELKDGRAIVESWDAKYGKPYLYEEIGELRDKLYASPGVRLAGFIVNKNADRSADILEKLEDVSIQTGVEIKIFNFSEWTEYKLQGISKEERDVFGKKWLIATAETFARKRLDLAPIDEPCDGWLTDLLAALKSKNV